MSTHGSARTRASVIVALALAGCACRGSKATPRDEPEPPPLPTQAIAPPVKVIDASIPISIDANLSAFVDPTTLAAGIRLDIRYATTNNFTKARIYPQARCLLRRPVAEALAAVQRRLEAQGLGLLIWDCDRPFSVQKRFWELVPDSRYVARPVEEDGVMVKGSKHNRGAAVDLTLVDASGKPLEMPTDYDDFTERAHRGNMAASPAARENAARLEDAMTAEGFEPLPTEWWHFDGPGWRDAALSDEPL